MLGVLLNNVSDGIDKGFGLTQALAKEDLESLSGDKDVRLIFNLPLVLLPAKQSGILEKSGSKWHLILTLGLDGGKIVFTLLEEVIAL